MVLAPGVEAALVAGLFGLLVGSFLNVVIHRLPLMMGREWLADAVGTLALPEHGTSLWERVFGPRKPHPPTLQAELEAVDRDLEALPAFSLLAPRSRCPHCGAAIAWYANIPVLSWLALRGRCAACKGRISVRYPAIEIVTGGLCALAAWRFGLSPTGVLWSAFAALLVCQFAIDLDTQYLPDTLNYALLWLALLGSALGWLALPLQSAVWGAVLGYASLWSVAYGYKLLSGQMGMGHGDFKLLAALGAWFGAKSLLAIILLSSVVGAVLGIVLLRAGRIAGKEVPIPFGPFLAGAGLLCFAIGPDAMRELLPFAFPFGR
jgi:leader peptidase (prepilin peptidase)/N-methyltransferase